MGNSLSEFTNLIRQIISGAFQDSDTIEWAQIEKSSGSGDDIRYTVHLLSDATTKISPVINLSGFSLLPEDTVLIYKIKNQLSNCCIIGKKNSSYERGEQKIEETVSFESVGDSQDDYFLGGDTTITLAEILSLGETCSTSFTGKSFSASASWNYGQPFDCGRQLNKIGDATTAHSLVSICNQLVSDYETIATVSPNDPFVIESGYLLGATNDIQQQLLKRIISGNIMLISANTQVDLSALFRVVGVSSTYSEFNTY